MGPIGSSVALTIALSGTWATANKINGAITSSFNGFLAPPQFAPCAFRFYTGTLVLLPLPPSSSRYSAYQQPGSLYEVSRWLTRSEITPETSFPEEKLQAALVVYPPHPTTTTCRRGDKLANMNLASRNLARRTEDKATE